MNSLLKSLRPLDSLSALGALTRHALLAAAAATLLPLAAHAQAWLPSKPIRLVVPFAPGGGNDTMARVLATKLSARLGQPVVVDNKAGGGGTIGSDIVAKAPPDGHTLLLVSGSLATNAASGKKLPFDPVKDFDAIGKIAASPFVIVVNNDLKANTLREFIDLARAKPTAINYGSAGVGGINHLGTELFASAARVQLTHVPYKGISLAYADVIGGTLQALMPSAASASTQIRGGKMRGLAVTSAERSPLLPEVPTAAEAGLPGFVLEVWYGLLAPAGLPAPVAKRLNDELNAALALPDVKELFLREGATPQPGTPAEFANLVRTDIARWTRLIKETGIQVE